MARANAAQTVADAWEQTLRETEDPFNIHFFDFFDLKYGRLLYRDYLTRHQLNYLGETIPRIVVVRRNLRRLGNIRLDPNRIP